MADSLDVYVNDTLAGNLQQRHGKLTFTYAPAWINSEAFMPLSVTMPPQSGKYSDDVARPFFENLLPEGEIRAAIAKLKQVSARNTFGLLEEIGGDCAGAVSLCPHGDAPQKNLGYSIVSDKRLRKFLSHMEKRPLLMMDDEVRLSLAGAQDKLPVYHDGTQIYLPRGSAPSTHILKPGSRVYAQMPINEHFCMRLANTLGLLVPESRILRKPDPFYLIERYDRKRSKDKSISRIQQIDFCQALNLPSSNKYEKEGGPSLESCFNVIARYSAQPAVDRLRTIDWVIFNFLIGNADAHGKNLSLLITAKNVFLAPFYDLISTIVYRDLTTSLAMKIGGENRPDWIKARHWNAFAKISGANPRIVQSRMATLSKNIASAARTLLPVVARTQDETATLDRICVEIEKRARQISLIVAPAKSASK